MISFSSFSLSAFLRKKKKRKRKDENLISSKPPVERKAKKTLAKENEIKGGNFGKVFEEKKKRQRKTQIINFNSFPSRPPSNV